MLVFVPLSRTELSVWAESGRLRPRYAHAVTPSLRAAFGFGPADDEDAEHTVLHIAGLAGLVSHGERLVVVADCPAEPIPGAEFGDLRVGAIGWSSVTSLFGEGAPEVARSLRSELTGRSLGACWDDPRVEAFLAANELLWHGPAEWRALT